MAQNEYVPLQGQPQGIAPTICVVGGKQMPGLSNEVVEEKRKKSGRKVEEKWKKVEVFGNLLKAMKTLPIKDYTPNT